MWNILCHLGVCSHYHRHWKGTCNLQKYNPFVPATSYWHFMISSEFHFHFKMIRSSIENEWIWISLHIDYNIRSLSWLNVFSYWFNKNYQFICLGTYNRGHRDLLVKRAICNYVFEKLTFLENSFKGAFNNYVDKKGGRGVSKKSTLVYPCFLRWHVTSYSNRW